MSNTLSTLAFQGSLLTSYSIHLSLALLEQTDTSSVMVALNRLFYPSYCKLFEISAIDPIRSVDFSFTNGYIVSRLLNTQGFYRNGVYLIVFMLYQLFDLIGQPRSLSSLVEGPNDILGIHWIYL